MNKEVRQLMIDITKTLTDIDVAIMGFDILGTKKRGFYLLCKNIRPSLNDLLVKSNTLPSEDIKADDFYKSCLNDIHKEIDFLDELFSNEIYLKKIEGLENYFNDVKLSLIELKNNLTK